MIESAREKSKMIFYILTSLVLLCGLISAIAGGVVLNFKEATPTGGGWIVWPTRTWRIPTFWHTRPITPKSSYGPAV